MAKTIFGGTPHADVLKRAAAKALQPKKEITKEGRAQEIADSQAKAQHTKDLQKKLEETREQLTKAAAELEESQKPGMWQRLKKVWDDKYMTPLKAGITIIASSAVFQMLIGPVTVPGLGANLWAIGYEVCGPLMVIGGAVLMAGKFTYDAVIVPVGKWVAEHLRERAQSSKAKEREEALQAEDKPGGLSIPFARKNGRNGG